MKLLVIILAFLIVCSPAARAQDLATEHTQLLNNVELIVNAERQLQSLLNQAQMIENQIEQLKSVSTYPSNLFVKINLQRSKLFDLVSEGVSLSKQIQNQLTSIQQEAKEIVSSPLSDQVDAIDQNSNNVIQITISRIEESRQSYQQQESAMQDLLAKNNQAVGQTQALQVLNQIQAQNVTQMQATQEAVHNLATVEAARMTQENAEKEARTRRINQMVYPVDRGSSSFDFGQ